MRSCHNALQSPALDKSIIEIDQEVAATIERMDGEVKAVKPRFAP